MKGKNARIVLLSVVLACLVLSGWGYNAYQNDGLLWVHMGVLAMLAYCLPMLWPQKELQLPVYTLEVLIGFVAFMWVYIDVFFRDLWYLTGLSKLFYTDGAELMIAGLFFIVVYICNDKDPDYGCES